MTFVSKNLLVLGVCASKNEIYFAKLNRVVYYRLCKMVMKTPSILSVDIWKMNVCMCNGLTQESGPLKMSKSA